MPDPVKKSFKEKRQDRQQGRVDKLTEERKVEAKKAGVNLDTPSDIVVPITQRKANIDQAIQKGVTDEMKAGLQKISALTPTPDIKTPEKPTLDLSIKDVRKKRRAKLADILNSLGQGLSGDEITPTRYRDALKDERLAQYNQYKSAVKGARSRANEWEAGYLEDLLAELNAKKNDSKITPLEQAQIDKLIQQTQTDLARQRQIETNTRLAKKAAATSQDEPTARVVSKDGNKTITREMPVSEAKQMENKADRLQKYNRELDVLNNNIAVAQYNLDAIGDKGTGITNKANRKERADLEAELAAAQTAQQEFADNYETYMNAEPTTQPIATEGRDEYVTTPTNTEGAAPANDFTNILNQYK